MCWCAINRSICNFLTGNFVKQVSVEYNSKPSLVAEHACFFTDRV